MPRLRGTRPGTVPGRVRRGRLGSNRYGIVAVRPVLDGRVACPVESSRAGVAASLGGVPLASVYPLVSSRSVARPFTYEVPDGVEKGAVVAVRFGRGAARGVVVETGVEAPPGIQTAPSSRSSTSCRRRSSISRSGSPTTTARRRRGRSSSSRRSCASAGARRRTPAARRCTGEAEPAQLTEPQQQADRADRRGARCRRRAPPARRADGQRQDGGLPPGVRRCARARAGRDRARPRDRADAADGRAFPGALRRPHRRAPLGAHRGRAARRARADRLAERRRVVVGARSAVFAPVPRLGLICVDEEHDSSYKQESDPRYDARTVAAKRAALEGAVAVYGSATPRPESWERLERLELGPRIGAPMPSVKIVDLRREAGYPLSAPLLAELGRIAEHGGKAILLLNRRGVAPAIHCRACGLSRRCELCDVALTLHRDGRLHCHHCGYSEAVPDACPACGSSELARIGAGTQRLEAELEKRVPELERIRLDADTARSRAPCARRSTGSRRRPRRARRHADGREGPSLSGCVARRRRRRGHGSRAAGLPRRGAHVPARHPARRPQRPRRARAGARADVPARRHAARATRPATTSPASSPRSSSAGASSATRPSAISSRSSPPAPTPTGRLDCSASCARS